MFHNFIIVTQELGSDWYWLISLLLYTTFIFVPGIYQCRQKNPEHGEPKEITIPGDKFNDESGRGRQPHEKSMHEEERD